MMKDLDQLIVGSDDHDSGPSLEALEAGVWRRVAERYERRRTQKLRVAIVAVALVAGIANSQWLVPAASAHSTDAALFHPTVGLAALTSAEIGG
ncbi:hypothetical protein [Brevundimonas sp.]|jgi:ribosomal protein L18E|uniref:hypothetical protein n=1 Tax=Brevundimonas sp. TaxID=1871086 RepID=UPI0028A21F25|nr:hypothetical protein [Brevundimonas sp.]